MSLPEFGRPGRALPEAIVRNLRNIALLTVGLASTGAGCSVSTQTPSINGQRLAPLVDLATVNNAIRVNARYATKNNFVGTAVDGYSANRCLLTIEAAEALSAVQKELQAFGLSLIVYDCYRPQRAVDHFMRWAADPSDIETKANYYPTIAKTQLIPEGYIAERSGHSRGSTVDLGLTYRDGTTVPMGTRWDFFDPSSHTEHAMIDRESRANRLLLRSVMKLHGFNNYQKEWWHYTLDNEPYADSYFDWVIEQETARPAS